MGQYIIHHKGAYNIYSTIVDAPLHNNAMTLDELTEEIGCEYGQSGVRQLPERLERARKNGTSAMNYTSLENCISCNRAGPDESELTLDEFVARFLALPEKEMTKQEAIDLAASGWWKECNAVEITRRQLFEERCIMDFGDFQSALESALGHSVWTHELGSKDAVEEMKRKFIRMHGP